MQTQKNITVHFIIVYFHIDNSRFSIWPVSVCVYIYIYIYIYTGAGHIIRISSKS